MDQKLDDLETTLQDLDTKQEKILTMETKSEEKSVILGEAEDENGHEIKDSEIIFSAVWNKLELKYGRDNLRFPREIIWLMGAPGSGKSYNAPFILKARGITAKEIIISDLLTSEEVNQNSFFSFEGEYNQKRSWSRRRFTRC